MLFFFKNNASWKTANRRKFHLYGQYTGAIIHFNYLCGMLLIDTHTHLYLEQFDEDRFEMVNRAIDSSVKKMLLPNIDSGSVMGLLDLCIQFPDNCLPMMGLHPTSVKENFGDELNKVDEWLDKRQFYGIGETGIDLYWDKSFLTQQEEAFIHQIGLAKKYKLPIVIHSRESFNEIFKILEKHAGPDLTGIFHCFTGNYDQARKIIEIGFLLGIGGVITYKNSGIDKVVAELPLDCIVLETDAPFLAPAPFRGKRNESAYITVIAEKIAALKGIQVQTVADITTENAQKLFNLKLT